jgi:hypothetical protein
MSWIINWHKWLWEYAMIVAYRRYGVIQKMNRIDWCFWDYDYIKERVRDFYDVETFIDKYSSGSETTENV